MPTTYFRVPKALQSYLAKQLAPMLLKEGARKVSESREEYKIQTVIGELFIHIQADFVHCCFEDVAAARQHFGDHGFQHRLNPCSGKWNWHVWDVQRDPDAVGNWRKNVLKNLAEIVWREIEDLTPKAAAERERMVTAK
jgi:hypothetical protein